MSAPRLLAVAALASGCSLHSLDYLQQGNGAADAGAEITAGSGGASSVLGNAGSAGLAGGAAPSAGAAGSGGAAAGTAGASALCADQHLNGEESDVDCGGRTCAPCADAKHCLTGSDCTSAICTNQVCQAPTCSDLARNGSETDLNCGGTCSACALGQGCVQDGDCESGQCLNLVCATPNCDGVTAGPGCPVLSDNTAYSLHPTHAPGSCVDDTAHAVDNGAEALQYVCNGDINQTYWAVAQPLGYFAFRSALSGKCLQVRNNSLAPGAVIEQSSCTGGDNQLFLPSSEAAALKLTIKSSGLSLDVAGAASTANGQALVQSVDDGSQDMRWQPEERTLGAFLTLNALGQNGILLRHVGAPVQTQASTGTDAEWKVVPGLADANCVSFEARDRPGAYLRHAQFLLWNDISDATSTFTQDATFCFRAPLSGSASTYRSLESINSPGYYVSADTGQVALKKFSNTSSFRRLATWVVGERH